MAKAHIGIVEQTRRAPLGSAVNHNWARDQSMFVQKLLVGASGSWQRNSAAKQVGCTFRPAGYNPGRKNGLRRPVDRVGRIARVSHCGMGLRGQSAKPSSVTLGVTAVLSRRAGLR